MESSHHNKSSIVTVVATEPYSKEKLPVPFCGMKFIEIYFLPESAIWNIYPRSEAEKIIYGKIPTYIEPYNEQDAKALLAWAEAVISDMNRVDTPKEQE